jgi:ligand-binding sensor domain-containing protein/DNA-binding CsgD family transcriptional regulator
MLSRTILFILTLIFSTSFYAQELPPIENYRPEIYTAGNQNWMISQSPNEYIYVANNSGLLEFNGADWKLYPSPNGTLIRSVKVIGDIIYTGCYMEMGYWKRDEYGNLGYYSLTENLNVPLIEDEQFWNILEFEDWVIFQSLNRIYLYNTTENSFNTIDYFTTKAEMFKVGKTIFFQEINKGIFRIENGSAVLVSDSPILQKNIVVGIFDFNKSVMFLTEKGEFYSLEGERLIRWNIPAKVELTDKNIYKSLRLKDGSFVLGTISNGVIQLDSDGQIIRTISKEQGINNNTVLSIFEDMEENLWLGLDNGISVLNLKSPFKVYNDLKGKLGEVYSATVFNDYIYLGTNQGVFYKPLKLDTPFQLIENTKGQVWTLNEIDGTLFCGHNNGTYIIEGNYAELICDLPGTWDIKKISNGQNWLLQGNYNGLNVLEKRDGNWQLRNKIDGFKISSRYFEIIDTNNILVNHDVKGVFKLSIDDEYKRVVNLENDGLQGYGSSLVNFNNQIVYSSNLNKSIYKYNLEEDRFIKDLDLSKIFYSDENDIIGTLIAEPVSSTIWGFADRNIICVSPGKLSDAPQVINVPISTDFRAALGVTGFENLTFLEDDIYLIGTSNGYAVLNMNNLKSREYNIEINAILKESNKDSIANIALMGNQRLKSNENNIYFSFNVPEYDKYSMTEFQYRMEGIDKQWSQWTSTSRAAFKYLPFGSYVFNVRARIGNRISNNVASYSFEIERPWLLSNIMIAVYLLTLILTLYLVHVIYKRHYKKQRERFLLRKTKELELKELENKEQLMRFKNEKLKQDIENKNRELGISTMSLIKKNEFLGNIKKELKNVNSIGNIKQIIRLIDKNINHTDDWNLFEEAFNNADKDFLKKIKLEHPLLTSNDLRLCAYLRLNLSSKEIAPLLNITPRSVEVKRYRLRKKIGLPHESSLTNYILEI